MICFSFWFWLWYAFYNRPLKNHIIVLSKCTSRLVDKGIHIKLVSSVKTASEFKPSIDPEPNSLMFLTQFWPTCRIVHFTSLRLIFANRFWLVDYRYQKIGNTEEHVSNWANFSTLKITSYSILNIIDFKQSICRRLFNAITATLRSYW